MTLIELMIALTILTFVLVSMAAYFMRFASSVYSDNNRSIAAALASDRLESIRGTLRYAAIDSMAVTEDSVPEFPGFSRVTAVTHVGGDSLSVVDHKVITVSVSGPKLGVPLKRTLVIAKF